MKDEENCSLGPSNLFEKETNEDRGACADGVAKRQCEVSLLRNIPQVAVPGAEIAAVA